VGECGLDFAVEGHDACAQEAAFRTQLRIARQLDLPLSVHCRKAWERLAAIVKDEGLPTAGALVHAFGGSAQTALELQALGFHLSFSCAIANPAQRKAAKVLPVVRPDRLLFESDAPDLPPRHLPDWDPAAPNEPSCIPLVAEAAARLRRQSPESVRELAHDNARRLFGRWLP
jgi:TatD DNase family protein